MDSRSFGRWVGTSTMKSAGTFWILLEQEFDGNVLKTNNWYSKFFVSVNNTEVFQSSDTESSWRTREGDLSYSAMDSIEVHVISQCYISLIFMIHRDFLDYPEELVGSGVKQ